MRAFVCHALTDDLSGTGLADVPTPEPAPGEVRVCLLYTSRRG